MSDPNLLVMCLTALVAVLVLLSALALVTGLLIAVFPGGRPGAPNATTSGAAGTAAADPLVAAAISVAAARVVPGGRVTRIEERS